VVLGLLSYVEAHPHYDCSMVLCDSRC